MSRKGADIYTDAFSDAAVRFYNCSAQHFVGIIQDWFSDVLGEQTPIAQYKFDHEAASVGELGAAAGGWDESVKQCSEFGYVSSCPQLVLSLSEVGYKGMAEYLIALLESPDHASASITQSHRFGWQPVAAFLRANVNEPLFDRGSAARIEGGGGSGAGFQVYCNGTMLVTAGGGGGGGIEGNLRSDYSVGGGGGGGAQVNVRALQPYLPAESLAADAALWSSVGGGSGCGTCSESDPTCTSAVAVAAQATNGAGAPGIRRGVLCGTVADADTTLPAEGKAFADALHEAMRACHRDTGLLWVEGGGGGGGGTAECCRQFMNGYGFGFTIGNRGSFTADQETGQQYPGHVGEGPGEGARGQNGSATPHENGSDAQSNDTLWYAGNGQPVDQRVGPPKEGGDAVDNGHSGKGWAQGWGQYRGPDAPPGARRKNRQRRFLRHETQTPQSDQSPTSSSAAAANSTSVDDFEEGEAPTSDGGANLTTAVQQQQRLASEEVNCTEPAPFFGKEQFKWDKVGYLLYNASLECGGDWGDWCCVCSNAKVIRAGSSCCHDWSFVFLDHEVCCPQNDTDASAADAAAKALASALQDVPNDSAPWQPNDDLGIWNYVSSNALQLLELPGFATAPIGAVCAAIESAAAPVYPTEAPQLQPQPQPLPATPKPPQPEPAEKDSQGKPAKKPAKGQRAHRGKAKATPVPVTRTLEPSAEAPPAPAAAAEPDSGSEGTEQAAAVAPGSVARGEEPPGTSAVYVPLPEEERKQPTAAQGAASDELQGQAQTLAEPAPIACEGGVSCSGANSTVDSIAGAISPEVPPFAGPGPEIGGLGPAEWNGTEPAGSPPTPENPQQQLAEAVGDNLGASEAILSNTASVRRIENGEALETAAAAPHELKHSDSSSEAHLGERGNDAASLWEGVAVPISPEKSALAGPGPVQAGDGPVPEDVAAQQAEVPGIGPEAGGFMSPNQTENAIPATLAAAAPPPRASEASDSKVLLDASMGHRSRLFVITKRAAAAAGSVQLLGVVAALIGVALVLKVVAAAVASSQRRRYRASATRAPGSAWRRQRVVVRSLRNASQASETLSDHEAKRNYSTFGS